MSQLCLHYDVYDYMTIQNKLHNDNCIVLKYTRYCHSDISTTCKCGSKDKFCQSVTSVTSL